MQTSWWEGLVLTHWWVEVAVVPCHEQGHVMGCVFRWLWVQYDFQHPIFCNRLCSHLGCCLAWGFPALESAGCWVEPDLGAKMWTSKRAHSNLFPRNFHHQCLCFHGESWLTSDPLVCVAWVPVEVLFSAGSQCMWDLVCTLQNRISVFPSLVELLHSSPAGL